MKIIRSLLPALVILLLVAISSLLAVAAQPPPQSCSAQNLMQFVSDDCGDVTYDLKATNGVDTYNAGSYVALGDCLQPTVDRNCNPNPSEIDGWFSWGTPEGNPTDGWNVWWITYDRTPATYMQCEDGGSCSYIGDLIFAPAFPGYYTGEGYLPGGSN